MDQPRLSYALICAAALVLGLAVLLLPGAENLPRDRGVLLEGPGGRTVLLAPSQAEDIASGEWALPMPGRRSVTQGMAAITYKLDRDGAQRALGRLARSGGRVRVVERPVQVMIDVPTVRQDGHHGGAAAALEMLLASRGVKRGQSIIRRALGQSLRLPALARRWIEPVDLSGQPPPAIFARLLEGRAVLAWIGCRSARSGRCAVLLVGLAGSRVVLNDPRVGARRNWSRQEFKRLWRIAGSRALSA